MLQESRTTERQILKVLATHYSSSESGNDKNDLDPPKSIKVVYSFSSMTRFDDLAHRSQAQRSLHFRINSGSCSMKTYAYYSKRLVH
ncbi:unnamed protein product [Rotaria sp. Silwood1]|nr:unnamed protein product [Rotaria sp. Silwood1]CAF1542209.1 unnamed protein product [Rotaria sp. Silwood1]CAF3615548.1 unnamed protein product [Rotaria sp. Silwood1]CAF4686078.1 unnamed protein product [Rotaria sp. Silwood1]